MQKFVWILGFKIQLYGAIYGVGTVFCFLVVMPLLARRRGVDWLSLMLPIAASVAVGWAAAHTAYGIINIRSLDGVLRHTFSVRGGNEGIAGYVGGLLMYFWFLRRPWLRARAVAADANDALAPALALMVVFFKIGCIFHGCCYGKPAPAGWGLWTLAYPPATGAYYAHLRNGWIASGAEASLPTLPAQALEALALGVVFAALVAAYLRRGWRGRLMFLFFIAYCVWRNISELWLRGDFGRGDLGWLTATQLMTIPIVAGSVYVISREGRRETRETASNELPKGA